MYFADENFKEITKQTYNLDENQVKYVHPKDLDVIRMSVQNRIATEPELAWELLRVMDNALPEAWNEQVKPFLIHTKEEHKEKASYYLASFLFSEVIRVLKEDDPAKMLDFLCSGVKTALRKFQILFLMPSSFKRNLVDFRYNKKLADGEIWASFGEGEIFKLAPKLYAGDYFGSRELLEHLAEIYIPDQMVEAFGEFLRVESEKAKR